MEKTYFKYEEFACNCCGNVSMDGDLIDKLNDARRDYGQPITVEPDDPYDVFEGATMIIPPYADYNKNFQTDTMMCWAVSTCNALENAGWATNADWCMYEMIDRFDDVPGYITDAILYWFELVGLSYVPAYGETDKYQVLNFIETEIDTYGLPVVIAMGHTSKSVGHAITVYGYKWLEPNESQVDMIALKVTDGDDRYSGVVDWVFYWNDSTNRYECFDRDFYLSAAYSIDRVTTGSTRAVNNYAPIQRHDKPVGK